MLIFLSAIQNSLWVYQCTARLTAIQMSTRFCWNLLKFWTFMLRLKGFIFPLFHYIRFSVFQLLAANSDQQESLYSVQFSIFPFMFCFVSCLWSDSILITFFFFLIERKNTESIQMFLYNNLIAIHLTLWETALN